MKIKVGTRGSKLALAQTHSTIGLLKKIAPEVEAEVCVIKTSGDILKDVSLMQIGGQGVFVKELEDALLSGRVDLAVHSMKDVPGEIPEGLVFAAILEREDPRDVLVTRESIPMESLPPGAKIGTGSQRRGAQIKSRIPEMAIVPIRGNIDTRLKKIETENLAGVVLAAAGMKRLGYEKTITQFLPTDLLLPAVGQGALGLQIRKKDVELAGFCARLNHEDSAAEVTAERSYLKELGGGCRLPIAAYGLMEGTQLSLEGLLAAPDGTSVVREKIWGEPGDAEMLGKKLAGMILENGGKKLLELLGSE